MTSSLPIHRDILGRIEFIGTIDLLNRAFQYNDEYLQSPNATPLSFSIPLASEKYAEEVFRPYFEGLLPEGAPRRMLAEKAGVREEDYLRILAESGLDCVGDVIVNLDTYSASQTYKALDFKEISGLLSGIPAIAATNAASRLSLAGTQGKVGLFHDETFSLSSGWHQPLGGAPSTHVLKIESLPNLNIVEYLCMTCADYCEINAAETHLLNSATPILCSKRFDRRTKSINGESHVIRLHQEDFTQALGLLPGSKYAELEPSTAVQVRDFILEHCERPLHALQAFAALTCFNYLIGNCDNHLKNLSMLHSETGKYMTIAPAYDLVSTTLFARFDRTMAMRIGNTAVIDNITPENFCLFAKELQITSKTLQELCAPFLQQLLPALSDIAKNISEDFPVAPYIADDLIEDIQPRIKVLERFCG